MGEGYRPSEASFLSIHQKSCSYHDLQLLACGQSFLSRGPAAGGSSGSPLISLMASPVPTSTMTTLSETPNGPGRPKSNEKNDE